MRSRLAATSIAALGVALASCGTGAPAATAVSAAPRRSAPRDCVPGWLETFHGQPVFVAEEGEAAVVVEALQGVYSTLLPDPTTGAALAVRTEFPPGRPARDALVRIEGRSLQVTELWRPGGRLLLMGLSGDRAALLHFDGSTARVATVDLRSGEVAHSAPVAVSREAMSLNPEVLHGGGRTLPRDLGEHLSAPRGPRAFVLRGEGERTHLVRLRGDTVTLEPGSRWCLPSSGRRGEETGLPVDGRRVARARVCADREAVATVVSLPSRGDAVLDCAPRPPLPVEPGEGEWLPALVVPAGCAVSVSFGQLGWASAGRVEVEPHGPDAYRVTIPPLRSKAFDWEDCLLEAEGARPWRYRFEWEFGYCERDSLRRASGRCARRGALRRKQHRVVPETELRLGNTNS